jgi:hypothetical protein
VAASAVAVLLASTGGSEDLLLAVATLAAFTSFGCRVPVPDAGGRRHGAPPVPHA